LSDAVAKRPIAFTDLDQINDDIFASHTETFMQAVGYAYHPSRHHVPLKARAFLDFVATTN
jgi:hypothetical protein